VWDLFSYASFQVALQKQGYFILPEPLAVCIGNCHQPGAPKPGTGPWLFPEAPPGPFRFSPGDPFPMSPQDLDKLKDWLPTPTPTPKPAPVPEPKPEPKQRDDEERRRRCRLVPRLVGRGDDPLAELYCNMVVPSGQSYDIYSAVGVAEIDSLVGRTWYECKCGYLSMIRAYENGQFWAQRAVDTFDERVRRQNRIAQYCGYQYRLIVSNRRVEEFLRARHPDITILRIESDLCD
jgi:hypothetical protein